MMSLLLIGCDSLARGEADVPETIRIAIGMPVEEFNRQPLVARQANLLDSQGSGFTAFGEPHQLEIELNGHALPFEGGGRNAFTYVRNGYYIPRSISDSGRIASITFNMNREPVSLSEAMTLAQASCIAMRTAGLSPKTPLDGFGSVTEQLGQNRVRDVGNAGEMMAAFTDHNVRAIEAVLCDVEDQNHVFQLTIVNSRRAANRYRGGGDEGDTFGEEIYRVSGYLSQNLGVLP